MHLIFDIDGTLLDSEKTGMLSLQRVVREELGRDMSLEELYPYFAMPSTESVKKLQFKDPRRVHDLWEQYYQELMDLTVPFPGTEETLQELYDAGHTLGVVTSRIPQELYGDPHIQRWRHYFSHIIGAADTERHKPFPDPLLKYMECSGARPEECLFIGDTLSDSRCAQAAGIRFALASWGAHHPETIPATMSLDNLGHLQQLLTALTVF